VDYVIDGFLLDYLRSGGAIRRKWKILDAKGGHSFAFVALMCRVVRLFPLQG
jgi:hypothetical protein